MRVKYKAFLCKVVMHRKAYIYIDDCRIEKELAESCIGGIHLKCLSLLYNNTLIAKPLKAMKNPFRRLISQRINTHYHIFIIKPCK